jgi:predicted metal-dependent hydrolase
MAPRPRMLHRAWLEACRVRLQQRFLGWMRRAAVAPDPRQGLLFATGGEAVAALVPNTAFAHLRSNKTLTLQNHVIGYRFERTRRRSIGMLVGPEGLTVRAPRWVTLAQVDEAVQERADWILRHLHDAQARRAREAASRIEWGDGVSVAYLGQPLTVRLMAATSSADQDNLDQPTLLRLNLPRDAAPQAIRSATHAWLQGRALALFEQRIAHFAPRLGVQVTRLSLSAARTRWGSAGVDGSVRLNWRLIHHDLACVDYVVVHELSHLRHMNHSAAFWRVVASVMPDYVAVRSRLQSMAHSIQD